MIEAIQERAVHYFTRFAEMSSSKCGVTRLPFSRENDLFIRSLKDTLNGLGKDVYVDPMGNVCSSTPKDPRSTEPHTYFISHYDSVPQGGRYDGVAGIVFGLIFLEQLAPKTRASVDLIAFNCEESSLFGQASIGSKVFFHGIEDVEDYFSLIDGREKLRSLIPKCQYASLSDGLKPRFHPQSRFYEIHVDQSHTLYQEQSMIGIVDHIAGQRRIGLTFQGDTGHSSSTDLSMRKDSLLAASHAVIKVRNLTEQYGPKEVVGTVTRLINKPNVMNMIPGSTEITVDIRGFNRHTLRMFNDSLVEQCIRGKASAGIEVAHRVISTHDPASMDAEHAEELAQAFHKKGFSTFFMPSMAWHDIGEVSRLYPSNLVFIPNESGESHSPKERMDLDVFTKTIDFFLSFLGGAHDTDSACSHS